MKTLAIPKLWIICSSVNQVMCYSRVIFSSSDEKVGSSLRLLGHLQVGLVLSNCYHNHPGFPVMSSVKCIHIS